MPRDVEEMGKALDVIYRDMYLGNGPKNPSITTRLFDIERILKDFTAIKWLLIAAIITGVANIVFSHIKFQ